MASQSSGNWDPDNDSKAEEQALEPYDKLADDLDEEENAGDSDDSPSER